MAWLFSLSAECGPDRNAAAAFAAHFTTPDLRSSLSLDAEGNWWSMVVPTEAGTGGIASEQEARALSLLGERLYQRLRAAPAYRYALVGVEVDLFRSFGELKKEHSLPFDGLVLADVLWEMLGSPVGFVPFSEGYHWRPYRGERKT